MTAENSNGPPAENQPPKPLLPHGLVSILAGLGFVLAVGLVLILPSLLVVHFVDWLELRGIGLDLSWIIGLWVLSAIASIAGYFLIQRTFISEVLNRRVVSNLPDDLLEQ